MLRTCLTGFAVAWGIFMIIFLLGAGNGLINANKVQMDRFMASSMMVSGRYTSKAYKGNKENREIKLNDIDKEITEKDFKGYVGEMGAEISQGGMAMAYEGKSLGGQRLKGVFPNYCSINKTELSIGRFINEKDMAERRKNVVISHMQAKELGGSPKSMLGKKIAIDNMAYTVVGITKDDQMNQNTEIFCSYSTIKSIYGKGDDVGTLLFTIKNLDTEEANRDFEQRYRARINTHHDAAPDDKSAIRIWNRKMNNLQMETGISIIRSALWIIGIFTLLSGIVGVSNIMLITVKERTHEFGIRKALGAKPWHILRMIIVESVLMTAAFGYIGMLCGIAANEYMNATAGQMVMDTGLFKIRTFINPTVGIDVCIQVVMVIIFAGTIAGLIPAIRAARTRPIEALRCE